MKNVVLFLSILILLFVTRCQQPQQPVDIDAEKAAIEAVIADNYKATENEDIELFEKTVALDPDNVFIGTEIEEKIVGWDALKDLMIEQFDKASDAKMEQTELQIKVSADGKFAWAVSICDFSLKMGDEVYDMPGCRLTFILEKRDGNWLIVHIHASTGAKG